MDELRIRMPDDMHLHLRDGDVLKAVIPDTARHFARAIVMPNLVPPIVTSHEALAYKQRIEAALPAGSQFEPLMTLYLTEKTDAKDVVLAHKDGLIKAVKLYPAGATTNSSSGVTDMEKIHPVLEAMSEQGVVLCVHGEVTTGNVDIFDRESVFIETVLDPIRLKFPDLKIVMEHITTSQGVDYARQAGANTAATITTHHLILNRNHLLVGGIRPHYYCLPVAKREIHRQALVEAAISGDPSFFLGTDSAPHTTDTKESDCGCAGVYSAGNTMSCLAHVFEAADALEKLEGFCSDFGADFYGLSRNDAKLTLVKKSNAVETPRTVAVAAKTITNFDPGFPLYWHVSS